MLQRSPRVVDGKGGVDVTNGDDWGTQLLEASGPEGGMILATKRTALAEITRSCNPRDEKRTWCLLRNRVSPFVCYFLRIGRTGVTGLDSLAPL
jgi:hypothetical protein